MSASRGIWVSLLLLLFFRNKQQQEQPTSQTTNSSPDEQPLESTHGAQPAGSSHSAAYVCYGTGSRCGPSHGRTNAAAANLRHLLTFKPVSM
jgi:hypothetical protein